jgi:hypothetical protein
MKTMKFSNLFIILLVLVFSFGCAQSITPTKDTCSEEQKAIETRVKEQLKLLSEAYSRNDYHDILRISNKYLTEDSIITINFFQKNGTRTQQSITPLDYKSILVSRLTAVIDCNVQFTDIKVEVAKDCKSGKVICRLLSITTMDEKTARQHAPYLFINHERSNQESRVTIKGEAEVSCQFEYQDEEPVITNMFVNYLKAELI